MSYADLIKRNAGVVVALTILAAPLVSDAQELLELQVRLQALLGQLAVLQGQAANQLAPQPAACPKLYISFQFGARGNDVFELQRYLVANDYLSADAITGYFGYVTDAAVRRFQLDRGIVQGGTTETTGIGIVGPATRATIATSCSYATAVPTFSTPTYANPIVAGGVSSGSTSCSVGGYTVSNGQARAFYSTPQVPIGQRCEPYSQTRQCTNGIMSGSSTFQYPTCFPDTLDSCSVGGAQVSHGESRTFYKQSIATSTASCSAYAQSRTCNDGSLSGDSAYGEASCLAGVCLIDGITVKNGESRTFFFAQNVPSGEQCASYAQSRTCSGSILSGNASYKYASCAPVASGVCVLDNVAVQSGSSATFYSAATAPSGTLCDSIKLSRTCTSGALSGDASYSRSSCSDTASCTQTTVTVPHGESYTFYSATSVPFGSTCSAVSKVRLCTNGSLSGETTYAYATCAVQPPTASLRSNLASALSALESALQAMLKMLGQ